MRRWRYALDPVCIACCLAYAANRWLIPMRVKGPFLRGHFADCLLIPAALPLLLWLFRRLGLRSNDAPPRWSEIGYVLVVWAIAAEVIAPHLFSRSTGDIWDVVSYAAGAAAAGLVWGGA